MDSLFISARAVSSNFLQRNPTLREVKDLLKHELLHYVCKNEGHTLRFFSKSQKLKINGVYDHVLLSEANKDWLEGRLSYEVNEQGKEVLIDKKKPSFKRFSENTIVERGIPIFLAYKTLRELNGLSIQEVVARSGINEAEIVKIETKDSGFNIFRNEAILKKVFLLTIDLFVLVTVEALFQ